MPAATDVIADRVWDRLPPAGPTRRDATLSTLIFVLLLAIACAWVLYLPVFPSQDGPVHVYYARVAGDLMLGGHAYDQQFRVARPFPPYSVHAYLLMAILPWTSSELAEKLLACFSMLVCGLGVLSLSRRMGRSLIFCALGVPFLLNRYLFLGFYGYTIAIGLALMAMAEWLRPDRGRPLRRVVFLALTVATLFSHPVPYLLLIAFCWLAVLAGWSNRRNHASNEVAIQPPTRGDLLVLIIASTLLLYIRHYSHSGMLWNYEWAAEWNAKLLRILDVFRTWNILPLKAAAYNFVLGAVLVGITVAALARARRESRTGSITPAQLIAGFALLVLFSLPLLPRTMNGSGFFADRFAIWPPLLLIAAAGAVEMRRKTVVATAGIAAVVLAVTLFYLNAYLGPIARSEDVSSIPAGIMAGERVFAYDGSRAAHLTYDPYLMAPVRAVDRSGAMLVNSPWTDLQIIMLDAIGPAVKFTPEIGPQSLTGAPLRIAVIYSHCGVENPNTAPLFAQAHPARWKVSTYGCFDIFQPAP
ncbi:MAG: hypothetical protein ACRD3E_05325 [Terriglobales bacterium]